MLSKITRYNFFLSRVLLLVFAVQLGLFGILKIFFFEKSMECFHLKTSGNVLVFSFSKNNSPVFVKDGFFSSGNPEVYIEGKLMDVLKVENQNDSIFVSCIQDENEARTMSNIGVCQLNHEVMLFDKKNHQHSVYKIFSPESDLIDIKKSIFSFSIISLFHGKEIIVDVPENGREGPPPDSGNII